MRAWGRDGERLELTARDYTARVIQHETDHLDGILFFDRMRSFESLTFLDESLAVLGEGLRSGLESRTATSELETLRLTVFPRAALRFHRPFRLQPFEFDRRMVGELHRVGDRAMTGHVRDGFVHLLADAPVDGWPCGAVRSSMRCIASRAFMSM